MSARQKQLALCLGGPTGCGKTAIAVQIAREFNCEIINADSRQVYADFPIITAQPDSEERCGIPHHLYGFLQPQEKISAGAWRRLALEKIAEINARGAIALLTGGTGLYFQALLRGLAEIPAVSEQISHLFYERMCQEGPEILYAELERVDVAYAKKIHPHDRQRIQRALEVHAATGRPFSWWHEHGLNSEPLNAALLFMDISLPDLEPRLGIRIDAMIAAGALEEARAAYAKCRDGRVPGWSGIGCAELFSWLEGRIDFTQCRQLWQANTRAYAKRQLTWFRARKEARKLAASDSDAIIRAAGEAIRAIREEQFQ